MPFLSLFRRGGRAPEYIVAGLGNPGGKYDGTRHNVGFRALDALAAQAGVAVKKVDFQALTAVAELGGHQALLMKPQTFMNLSGDAVGAAAKFYKIPPERVIIIADDVSLEPGRVRLRVKGSAGGHNGLKSIIARLSSEAFPRVKVGVGAKPPQYDDLADWVLGRPAGEDALRVSEGEAKAAAAAAAIIAEGFEAAQQKYSS